MSAIQRSETSRDPLSQARVSVVVPVHNERHNVAPLLEQLDSVLEADSEVVLVDDGSTDGTVTQALTVAPRNFHLRVVRLTRNFGQSAAIQAGIDAARSPIVVTMDGDLQNDPGDIPTAVDGIRRGNDLVCGYRVARRDRFFRRRLPSLVGNALLGLLTGVRVRDTGCALRAYRTEMLREVRLGFGLHRFLPVLMALKGARMVQIPVQHRSRVHGRSHYGLRRTYPVVLDLLWFTFLTRLGTRPFLWTLWLGLLMLPVIAPTLVLALAAPGSEALDRTSLVIPATLTLIVVLYVHLFLVGILGELVLLFARAQERSEACGPEIL